MKTITCLVLAVILLTFIAENGDGKITILHEGRVSGKPRRKSRRQTVRKRPSTTANEDNGSTIQDRRRPVVCNHTINVCLLLFQRLLSLWSRYLSSVNDPTRRKKLICVFFPFTEIQQMARVPTLDDLVTLKHCSPQKQSGQDTVIDYVFFIFGLH